MSDVSTFYKWFDDISKKLGVRETGFRKIFKYLDSQPTPIIIVETGCLRKKDNFLDGQSTLLFDKYTLARGSGSKVYTVDINPESTKICREIVSQNTEVTTEDSVHYLNNISKKLFENKTKVSMFYLDSFDLDWRYEFPSASHHMKELAAITKILEKNTLVVVDDSPASANVARDADNLSNWKVIADPAPAPTIGGKGYLVHEYACHVGASLIFSHYLSAWNGFNK